MLVCSVVARTGPLLQSSVYLMMLTSLLQGLWDSSYLQ